MAPSLLYRQPITVEGAHVKSTMEDVLVLVDVPTHPAAEASRMDLRFTLMDGTPLRYQMTDPDPGYLDGNGFWNRNGDPHQVELNGKLLTATVREARSYITEVDAETGLNGRRVLLVDWGNTDDHRIACIVPLPDGRCVFFLTGHGGTTLRYWITKEAGNIESIGPEHSMEHPLGYHYSHLSAFRLADEGDRIICVFRANNTVNSEELWSFITSDDLSTADAIAGATFSEPKAMFQQPDNSYIKVDCDRKSRLDFQITDGTPQNPVNKTVSLYHAYMDGEAFFTSDGEQLATWSELTPMRSGGIEMSALTKVVDWSEFGSVWNWSIRRRADGSIIQAFTASPSTLSDVDDISESVYMIAEWTAEGGWAVEELVDAGGPVSLEGQPAGAGGIYIDWEGEQVYLSRPVAGNWEMERWTRKEGGGWDSVALSEKDTQLQFRPKCPMDRVVAPEVSWAAGRFFDGNDFLCRLRSWPAFPSPYARTSAWVRIPKLTSGESFTFLAHFGIAEGEVLPLEPEGFDVWPADVTVMYDMVLQDLSGSILRDSLGTRNALLPVPSIVQQEGLHGRSRYWGPEATGGMATPAAPLTGLPQVEFIFCGKTDRDNGAPRTMGSNIGTSTEPWLQTRTKNLTNKLEARAKMDPDTTVGGEFGDLALTKNADFIAFFSYDSVAGLKAQLNDKESATVYATGAVIDKTTPINRTFGIGKAPGGNTEMWAGQCHFAILRKKARSSSEKHLDYMMALHQGEVIALGEVEDLIPPESTITEGPGSPVNETDATFAFESSDEGSTFEVRIDGGAWAPATSPFTTPTLAEGPHLFEVRAIDKFANVEPTPSAWSWTIDTTPPQTTITKGPADGPWQKVQFAFTTGEATATFEIRLDGGPWTPATSPYVWDGLDKGRHRFEVRGTDEAENLDATPALWEWRVFGRRPLTPLGLRLRNELPGWTQSEPLYEAAAHVAARESERLIAKAEAVRDSVIPSRLGELALEVWEAMVKLPRNPPGRTTEQRWDAILPRLRRVIEDPSGTAWIARVTDQIGLGWHYEEESPNIIKVTVPWQPGSEKFVFARRVFEAEIPAAWELIFGSSEGFILDQSLLDVEPFHSS